MVRVSNNLVVLLNLVTFLLSIPILGGGIWLANRASTDCEKFLEKPAISIGAFLLLVSLAGLIGAWRRVSWLLWAHLLVMFILVVILFSFTVFAFVITNEGAGEVKRVESSKNWNMIKNCIVGSRICTKFNQKYLDDFSVYDSIVSSSLETARQSYEFASLAADFNSQLVIAHQTIDRLKEEAVQREERCQLKEEAAKLKSEVAELKADIKEL